MRLRPRITYANVAATIALVLAAGGGTVYAAVQLGKNDVHGKNIARNAVTSPKIKNRAIKGRDLVAGLLNQVADVKGAAKGGPQGGVNTNTTTPLALTGKTTFTPKAGQVSALAAEAQFTSATTNAANFCSPAVFLLVNGQPTRVFLSPEDGNSTTLAPRVGRDADGPFGLLSPKAPISVTAQLRGDVDCTADSRLDRVEVRILQIG